MCVYKNKNKKKKGPAVVNSAVGEGGNGKVGTKKAPGRLLGGFTDSYIRWGQTEPPTIPTEVLFQGIVIRCWVWYVVCPS